ncbi:MAG TPA: protein TolR [Permianibacter sp.]|nr:protein TolR [Permianibacter sp.]
MAKRRRQVAEINVVPYIDVMLVLLVIFMITTPIITTGVNVELPEAEAEPMSTEKEIAVITVDRNGQLFLDVGSSKSGPFEPNELLTEVSGLHQQKPDMLIALGGDKYTEYGNVLKVFVQLKRAGINNVALMTDDSALEDDKRRKNK